MARACALHRRASSSSGSFFSRDRNVSGCSNQSASVSGLGKWNTGRLRGVGSRRFVKQVTAPLDSNRYGKGQS